MENPWQSHILLVANRNVYKDVIHIPLLFIRALHYTCVPTDVHVSSQFGTKRLLLAYYRYLYNMYLYVCSCYSAAYVKTPHQFYFFYICMQAKFNLSSQFITLHAPVHQVEILCDLYAGFCQAASVAQLVRALPGKMMVVGSSPT